MNEVYIAFLKFIEENPEVYGFDLWNAAFEEGRSKGIDEGLILSGCKPVTVEQLEEIDNLVEGIQVDINQRLSCKCDMCQKVFTEGVLDSNQAEDCASTISIADNGIFIQSHYGSKFDGNLYEVLDPEYFWIGDNNFCDNCVNELISKNAIRLISTFESRWNRKDSV